MEYNTGIDWAEVVRRALRYLGEGLAVGMVTYILPRRKLDLTEVIMVSITAAAALAILDLLLPLGGSAARLGIGATFGSGLAGGVPITGSYM